MKDPEIYAARITRNPDILAGKPVVAGTRIPVERVLAHLARNADLADLFAAYPELTDADVRACFAYARAVIERSGDSARRSHSVPATHQ